MTVIIICNGDGAEIGTVRKNDQRVVVAVVLNVDRVCIAASLQTVDIFRGTEKEHVLGRGFRANLGFVESRGRHHHRVGDRAETFNVFGHAVRSVEIDAGLNDSCFGLNHCFDVGNDEIEKCNLGRPLHICKGGVNEPGHTFGSERLTDFVFGERAGDIKALLAGVEFFSDIGLIERNQCGGDILGFCASSGGIQPREISCPNSLNRGNDLVVNIFLPAACVNIITEKSADRVFLGVEHNAIVAEYLNGSDLFQNRRKGIFWKGSNSVPACEDFGIRAAFEHGVVGITESFQRVVDDLGHIRTGYRHSSFSPFENYLSLPSVKPK